jgi:uncharacterized membrane protein
MYTVRNAMNARLLPAALLMALAAPAVLAQTPEEKGLEIAREAVARALGIFRPT